MARQLALAKKVSLEGIAPDWGEDCYAMMLPATYADMLEVDGIEKKSKAEQVAFQMEFLKSHFVSGKIRLIDMDGPVDMKPEDVAASITLSDRLFAACLGDDLDPKEVRRAAAATQEPESDDRPTETQSSTT